MPQIFERSESPCEVKAQARTEVLQRFRVIDGPPEPSLQRLTALAARVLGMEAALISFVCDDQIYLHSIRHRSGRLLSDEFGPGTAEMSAMRQLPRDCSVCDLILETNDLIELCDVAIDERCHGKMAIRALPAIRFYAGVPLTTAAGLTIGTLSVMDHTPQKLNVEQRGTLEELACCVMDALEARALRLSLVQNQVSKEQGRKVQIEELQQRLSELVRQNSQMETAVRCSSMGVVISDCELPDSPIIYANPAFKHMTGYESDEIIGFNCRFLQGASTNTNIVGEMRVAVARGLPFCCTLVNYRKDGTPFWNELTLNPIHDANGKLINFVGVQHDVTDKMEDEAALQRAHDEMEVRVQIRTLDLNQTNLELSRSREELRALAAHLDRAQEEERTRIGREIHDELGQMLSGLKMEVAQQQRQVELLPASQTSDLVSRLGEMSDTINGAIASVRRIASNLRPGVLDHFGLSAAIEWQAEEFSRRAGARYSFSSNIDDSTIGSDRSSAIFRITQEALTNIARHAGASRVTIGLRQNAHNLTLQIKDNGRGVPSHEERRARNFDGSRATPALGLVGMEERALLLGGTLSVEAGQGKTPGTTVTLVLPFERRKRAATPATATPATATESLELAT